MFLFGMRTPEVAKLRTTYNSREFAAADPEIAAALQMIKSGVFSPGDPLRYEPILRALLDYNDYYMLIADLRSYVDTQTRVDATYRDQAKWNRMSLVNIARSGLFSSDRAVAEYARNIWKVAPVMFG
jgi:starch phosphorylase